jgi:Holliday junction resolvase-like predicted endonuclease
MKAVGKTVANGRPGTRARGQQAEQAAADHYAGQGYEILARNYLVPRLGELDLVLYRQNRLSFVEVKARHNAEAFGGLPAAITPAKLRRLRKAAWCFLKERQYMNMDTEFLAALVDIDSNGGVVSLHTEPIEWL